MPKRILVADDSVTIQKAFAMVFGGQDITLAMARSADEALSSARQGRPDLVIADAALGNGNGYDLCAALKAEPTLRAVPVLILASSHVPYDDTRGQRVGAVGALIKPFESQSLIDQVSVVLARGDGGRATAVVPQASPPPVRETARTDASSGEDDDDYGEFTIERPAAGAPAPVAVRPAAASGPARSVPPAASPAPAPALRPSLIPGVRPGAPLPARPAMAPAASVLPPSPGLHRQQPVSRTMVGLPTAAPAQTRPSMPAGVSTPAPARPAMPAAAPVLPRPATSAPAPAFAPARPSTPAPASAGPRAAPVGPAALPASAPAATAISTAIAQKMAAVAARGPEYEAIAKLSREIIEQVVWEVVPELAEMIIRQEVDRLASAKR
jgi:CheY-like chemotaxis protein